MLRFIIKIFRQYCSYYFLIKIKDKVCSIYSVTYSVRLDLQTYYTIFDTLHLRHKRCVCELNYTLLKISFKKKIKKSSAFELTDTLNYV